MRYIFPKSFLFTLLLAFLKDVFKVQVTSGKVTPPPNYDATGSHGKMAKNFKESQGTQIQLIAWNPDQGPLTSANQLLHMVFFIKRFFASFTAEIYFFMHC